MVVIVVNKKMFNWNAPIVINPLTRAIPLIGPVLIVKERKKERNMFIGQISQISYSSFEVTNNKKIQQN